MKMIRKQVYIEPRHERMLKRASRTRGVPESKLIREGIERVTSSAGVGLRDPAAWDRFKRSIRSRARLRVAQTGRTWTRAELYEERLSRFGSPPDRH